MNFLLPLSASFLILVEVSNNSSDELNTYSIRHLAYINFQPHDSFANTEIEAQKN